jgi:hypothetical protein
MIEKGKTKEGGESKTKDGIQLEKENFSTPHADEHTKRNKISFSKIQNNLKGDIVRISVDEIWVASVLLAALLLIGLLSYAGVLLWGVHTFEENVSLGVGETKDGLFHSEQVLEVLHYYGERETNFENLKVSKPDIPKLR